MQMVFHIKWQRPQNFLLNAISHDELQFYCNVDNDPLEPVYEIWRKQQQNKFNLVTFFSSFHLFIDDRRRGTRIRPTEDNRRHTLGHTNDMHAYSQQNQNMQQRAMDLEVNIFFIKLKIFYEIRKNFY